MKNLRMELTGSAREQIYQSILDSSHLDLEYSAMLAFAGLIALFGLLQNSVAVIIGAMLISPLMNPVLAAALALILGDWSLGRRAASVLAWSIGGVIALTWLVAWLTPLKQVTPEILARTNPNLLDMLVAVLAGLAGTLALRGGPVSLTIIPGVAIAVAVVPPLSVVGFSLSTRHGSMAWGGFLLFVTNLVSIMISAAVVFRLMGFVPHKDTEEERAKLRKRMAVSALVLIILAVPLVQTLSKAVTQISLRAEVEEVVNRGFKTGHSTVADLSYARATEGFKVNVTVRTTQYFGTAQIDAVQAALRKRFGANAQLLVDQLLVTQGGLTAEQMARIKDFISGKDIQHEPKEEPFDFKATHERITDFLQKQVDEALMGTSIKCTGPVQVRLGTGGPLVLSLQLLAPEPLEEQTVKLLASQLSTKVSSTVEVHGVVELEGSNYQMALELPDCQRGLDWKDRRRLNELVALLLKRPDLHLQASLSAKDTDVEALKASRLWIEVQSMLSRSRLKASQWSMQASPTPAAPAADSMAPASPPAPPKAKGSPPTELHRPVRCDFNVLQVL